MTLEDKDDQPRTDQDLISAVLTGDGPAFAVLMKRHRPPLLEMACRILGQREEAEDVLQEVFMSVHAHLDSFRGEAKLSTWLYTIALNRVRNHIRRRGKHRYSFIDAGPEESANRRELPEKGPLIEEIVAQKKDAESLRLAVEQLPETFRLIFILHYYQYLPLKMVAQRLEKPLGTIKVYLHRARKIVFAALQGNPSNPSFSERGGFR
ncbi:MAG: sigma-70 family RNA polymerase sigma factor [Elusimicrobia bacterium]|nr:sigma-70 family RNA polymerase sigma factor [Elusimicrobiota bacterium]